MSSLESLRQKLEHLETLHHLSSASLQSRATPDTPHKSLQTVTLTSPLEAEHLASTLITQVQQTAQQLLHQLPTPIPRVPQTDFYNNLRVIRETHRVATPRGSNPLAGFSGVSFSGEESAGRCLDLLVHHRSFINLKGVKAVDYVTYLRHIDRFTDLPPGVRSSKSYQTYLESLVEYLEGFVRRAYPLEAHILGDVRGDAKADIMRRLEDIAGEYASGEEVLRGLGDGVKDVLLELGLKCGGRPEERCKRLLEAARKGRYGTRAVVEKSAKRLLEALCEERAATVANVEKKLAQSFAEVLADRDGVVEESDEEEVLYNPKDIPLGWDGKPMPYWMYKLHGLNHVFGCEICGGASYRGPRAFERHFSEGVHVAGLRRLGIGYSKAFMMVTKIEDAVRLQKKIDVRKEKEADVEFEDADGNVMNQRTWADLRRQGLI